jgi:ATP-dependent helicase/nuclease subunit A
VNASTLHPLVTATADHWLDHVRGTALHTDRPSPDSDLPLPFDAVGPDDLGQVVHDVLTTAVAREVSTDTLERCGGPLEATLESAVAAHAHGASRSEAHRVMTYVRETVCPQFAETDAWDRLQTSAAVYVEEPLDDVLSVGDYTIETRNHADLVSRTPNGTWHVDDIKLALASVDTEMRRRYGLQAAFYVWLLDRQLTDPPVEGHVTYLGQHVDSTDAGHPLNSIESWLTRFD